MTETNYKMKGCPAPIAFLADTHDTAPGPILASLRSRPPALIVHTGDFLHGWKQQSGVNIEDCHNALNLLRGCAEGKISASESYSEIRRHHKTPMPETGWLRDFADADGYHILLMHHPEYISKVPASVELTLSGHAHGGQWRFYDMHTKQWRGVYAPDQGQLPKLTSGIVDGRLIISRGLSNPAFVPRLNNDTEIIYIENC